MPPPGARPSTSMVDDSATVGVRDRETTGVAASLPATSGRDWLRTSILAATAVLIYVATLSHNYSGDTMRYAVKAETQGPLAGIELYHVFNQPLAWLAWQAARLTGWQARSLVPIQLPNALAGGLAVSLMFLLARRLGMSSRGALVAATGLGLSCATWLLSTDGEYVMPGMVMALLPLTMFYGASPAMLARSSFVLILGGLLALAGLAFQTNLLLLPVLLWAVVLRRDLPADLRRRAAGLLLLAAVGLYTAGYGLALAAQPGPLTWQGWRAHPGLGLGYGLPDWSSLPHGAYALVRSLVGFPGLSLSDSTRELWAAGSGAWRAAFVTWYALAALIFAAPLIYGLRVLRREGTHGEVTWPPLLLWALLAAAFATFWVPGDLSFWVVVLVPWWLLTGQQLGNRPQGAALVTLLTLINGAALVLPNHDASRNLAYREASGLAGAMEDGDLLMVPVEGRLQVYAYYLTRGAVFVPGAGNSHAPSGEQPRATVERAMTAVLNRGGRLLVYGWETDAWPRRAANEDPSALLDGLVLEPVPSEASGSLNVVRR